MIDYLAFCRQPDGIQLAIARLPASCHDLRKISGAKLEALDKWKSKAKIPGNSCESSLHISNEGGTSGSMTSKPFPQPHNAGKQPCKHPRVQIVSREEDAEFLECLECREIFEASELKDMSIEEKIEGQAQE